jgi:hypothetical protein
MGFLPPISMFMAGMRGASHGCSKFQNRDVAREIPCSLEKIPVP